jgi:anthranilate/para-aminobenzoate synthase component I
MNGVERIDEENQAPRSTYCTASAYLGFGDVFPTVVIED